MEISIYCVMLYMLISFELEAINTKENVAICYVIAEYRLAN